LIVVDASPVVELLLRTPAAPSIQARMFDSHRELHAPHLIDIEVTQVLRRYVLAGELDAEHGQTLVADLALFPLQRHPHHFLLRRVCDLRNNLSAYDATYLALAEALDAALLTDDKRLVAAARRHSWIRTV